MIDRIEPMPGGVLIRASTGSGQVSCPACGSLSSKVHSRYERSLGDLGAAGQQMRIRLRVRRLFCHEPTCARGTFVEQVPGLTSPYGRRTAALRRTLEAVGVALAGRAGARLAGQFGVRVSRSTVLRMVRDLPDPSVTPVKVLGVDDFALRRGHVYGTVLIDMDTHHRIDLLADRTADTFAQWLRDHPGTEVICRDRSGAYAQGGRDGAPAAIQVADRWHLWHNLGDHVEKTVLQHRADLEPTPKPDTPEPAVTAGPTVAPVAPEKRIITRTKRRYAQVTELRANGWSLSAICRKLHLDMDTVRRFANAADVSDLLIKTEQRASLLDGFTDHLHRRWAQGCTEASLLTREITAQGYRGSAQTVRRYLQPLRGNISTPATTVTQKRQYGPTIREVTGWIMRRPESLTAQETTKFERVRAASAVLARTATLVAEFAQMLLGRHGDRLESWLTAIETSVDLPHLRSFTVGLRRDHAAVTNGLTLQHSSGAVEGTVNKIKMIKRQMYGRANLDLLRKRLIHAT